MALVIRLKRMGKIKAPFYRIVVADERRASKGGKYIAELGYYSPIKNPPDIKVNTEKVSEWIKKGAKISETVKSIIKKTDIYKSIAKMKNIEK
ncbi:MAG: 30S ribosomal protein S16 [Candidatus Goldbacteria bacterium]|nr:30S ribosomal protein S16 [Candidatus Goldiibacteriota bacterium]